MRVLIITGGSDSEREISLISAEGVKKALEDNNHTVIFFDIKEGFPELEKQLSDCDLVFPVLHGKQGEDGTLYRFLKSSGKPFIGSDPDGAKVAFDKILFKQYCEKKGYTTAKWKIVKSKDDIAGFGFPCVLKAAEEGSSKGIYLLNSQEDIPSVTGNFYVEELLKGIEITVGVLKDKVLPVIEIIPPEGKWFDYKNKYSGKTQEIVNAPSVKQEVQELAKKIALEVHQDLKLNSYSRADFIVVDDIPYILETNTPSGVGFTPESLFPKAAKAVGIEFKELINQLVTSVQS